jgi:hypothetical protein
VKNFGQHDNQLDFALQQPTRDIRDKERKIVLDLRRGANPKDAPVGRTMHTPLIGV